MRVTYDNDADAAYIYLKKIKPGDVKTTESISRPQGTISLDFDRMGTLVGIEVICAKALLPKELIKKSK